ncbi:MAG: hypothetical protein WA672_11020 [Candidatus Angelobacter sp.]
MKMLLVVICLMTGDAQGQVTVSRAAPEVKTVTIEEGAVTAVYLSPGYATSIRLPEEISSVVVGNPANFKAEHSDSEPTLVFLKPITTKSAESNALITTKSGQEISLHLISGGQGAAQSRIDFLLEYRRAKSMLISPASNQSFFVSETKPLSQVRVDDARGNSEQADSIAEALAQQKVVATLQWAGNDLQAAVGESLKFGHQTILGFSILNQSKRTIELLPPQIELSGRTRSGKNKQIKAEPVAITEYRMTSRRLGPGERADGVVVFERPAFKESSEKIELQLAEASEVDRPLLLPIPFTATTLGGTR